MYMEKTSTTRRFSLIEAEPSPALYQAVLRHIDRERARRAKIRFAGLSVLAFASLGSMIPAFQYAVQEFARTGAFQYLSLVFSDGSLMAMYWKEFIMTIVESIPILGIAFLLSAVALFLASVTLAIKNMRVIMLEYKY